NESENNQTFRTFPAKKASYIHLGHFSLLVEYFPYFHYHLSMIRNIIPFISNIYIVLPPCICTVKMSKTNFQIKTAIYRQNVGKTTTSKEKSDPWPLQESLHINACKLSFQPGLNR